MRRCVACGNSIERGAVLPANPIRRQDFLENLCLTKYSEFIANKCFICFDHFDPQDVISRDGVVVKLRHSQVVPIKLSTPFHNPRLEQKVNKLASERLAWSGNPSKLLGEDSDDVDDIEHVESPQSSEMNRRSVSARRSSPNQSEPARNTESQIQANSPPEEEGMILSGAISQCFLCGKVINNGASIPRDSYYRSEWRKGLNLDGYLPKTGMICLSHFRLDDIIFSSSGEPLRIKSGVAPVFKNPGDENNFNEPPKGATPEIAGPSTQGVNLESQTTSADNSKKDLQHQDESIDQQSLDSHVLNRNVCGARIRYNGGSGSDVPGKPSSCDIDPVSNIRFYEPHYRPGPEEMFCLSQVTQIGEKICSIENKFSQLVDLVTEFVMAKANAIEEQSNTAALRHQQRMNYEYQMQRKQEILKEQKRRERKARKTVERNKELEEKRQRKDEIKNMQPYLLYNGLKIYFPTSMRNDNRVCKVCYAKFDNKILLADHLMSETDLNDEHYRCFVCEQNVIYLSELAVQQHVMQAHPFEHEPRYGLFDDLTHRSKEVIRAYAEKMVGDNANVISLDSDSDGQPNDFFKDTAKKVFEIALLS
ncbi:hypothetical protein DdX_11005 [Ditylenchus destructor]|uniref:Uncharacterized protein n=1 Tax=Ditylenchus destructor TaxID=166010 RepID=A0AAD4MY78_9BILA|nr:hypothetical protein DdX_11005 [Ditylenchus destructor]